MKVLRIGCSVLILVFARYPIFVCAATNHGYYVQLKIAQHHLNIGLLAYIFDL